MNIHKFDFNLLLILHALLTERSVTRAAQSVFITQPAASNALKRLREIFADPLLVRSSNCMHLTPRALSLITPVQNALNQVELILECNEKFDPKKLSFTLHLAVSEYVAFVLMPLLLKDLRANAPNLHLVVRDVDREHPLRALQNGTVDLIAAFVPDTPRDLHSRTLFRDSWVCIFRKNGFPNKTRLTKRMFNLASHVSLPMQTGGSAAYLQRILGERGVSRNIAVSMPHYLSIPRLVSSTDLVMTIPERLALELTRQMPLDSAKLPVDIPSFSISMLWHERNESNSAHAWIRERLLDVASRISDQNFRR